MKDAIDGLDEMDDIDFRSDCRAFLRQLCEAIGWTILLVGFVLAMTYLTPSQRSAEADLFDAQINGEAPK